MYNDSSGATIDAARLQRFSKMFSVERKPRGMKNGWRAPTQHNQGGETKKRSTYEGKKKSSLIRTSEIVPSRVLIPRTFVGVKEYSPQETGRAKYNFLF
jgi:hypothetical protein